MVWPRLFRYSGGSRGSKNIAIELIDYLKKELTSYLKNIVKQNTYQAEQLVVDKLYSLLGICVRNYYVEELEDQYRIYVVIPGADKNSIRVSVQPKTIRVQARNAVESRYLPREYSVRINVGEEIDVENTRARYVNGVLLINAPKKIVSKEVTID